MSAREHLIDYALVSLPNEVAFKKTEELADAFRAEVLREAADKLMRIADETEAKVAEHYGTASGIGPGSAEMVREAARTVRSMANEAGKAPREGETTQRVWQVFEEDGARHALYTTEEAARLGTIGRYEEMEGHCPDYSWRTHDDDSLELVAGGDPVGIYLASLTVLGQPDTQQAGGETTQPADFFQPGHTYRGGRTTFRCDALTTHPTTGERLAMGWLSEHGEYHRPTVVGINQWNHEYDGAESPTGGDAQ